MTDNRERWWHVPRSRGALTGALLVLLGLWGGLAPFIGPYLGYGYTPDSPWAFTFGRLWLQILPAAATFLGGLVLLGSANRVNGVWGSWLAIAGGAWFVVGGTLSRLWTGSTDQAGTPTGGMVSQVVQTIGLFLGLGVVIVFLGSIAMTRFGIEAKRVRPLPAGPAPAEPEHAARDLPERERTVPRQTAPEQTAPEHDAAEQPESSRAPRAQHEDETASTRRARS